MENTALWKVVPMLPVTPVHLISAPSGIALEGGELHSGMPTLGALHSASIQVLLMRMRTADTRSQVCTSNLRTAMPVCQHYYGQYNVVV